MPGQVHGTAIAWVGSGERGRGAHGRADVIAATDGLLTREAGVPLLVSFADCVPVLLVAGRPARAVALVHAGWRGMLAGIVAQAARAVAAAGAAGRRRHRSEHRALLLRRVARRGRSLRRRASPGTWRDGRVDLWEAARRQLVAGGFAAADVVASGLCTCHDHEFFSHRREHGCTGRQAAIAWITGGSA